MAKVIVIGNKASILFFKAAGAELREVSGPDEAKAALKQLSQESEPAMVMIPEDLAAECAAEIAAYRQGKERGVLPIPSLGIGGGSNQRGRIRALVARALGVDLLGREG